MKYWLGCGAGFPGVPLAIACPSDLYIGGQQLQKNIQPNTLCAFGQAVIEQNRVMNLTAITEPDAVAQLHLLDSAALLQFVDLKGKTVVDVGTGAGFPGMPLRILEDDFDLTLLDSLGKRVNWLQEVCDELQLKRVACVHARAEEFAMQHREQFDIATSRAVAQLSILSELCLPLIKVGAPCR